MTALHASWLLAVPLIILPGYLLHRLLPSVDDEPVEELFVSITAGVWLTSLTSVTVVGLVGMLSKVHVRAWLVMLVALAYSGLFLWRLARRGPLGPQLRLPRLDRHGWLVLAVAVAIMAATGFYYNRMLFDEERCIIRSSVLPYLNYWEPNLPMLSEVPAWLFERNGYMIWNGGLREGMAYVITPFMAIFEFLGFRMVYAFGFFVIAGGIYTIVRRLAGGRLLPILAMLFSCLNPYTLRMMDVDDNLFAMAAGTVAMAWLLRGPASWFWWMLPYGLFVGIRHECLLTLPGVLLFLHHHPLRYKARRRRRRELALGAFLFTLPFVITHINMLLSLGITYEPFTIHPPLRHSFLGLFDFTIRGGLNWPFTDRLLRSYHTPFPTLLAFPLDMLASLGVAPWALVPAGLLGLWRQHRAWFWLCLGWFLPFMAMLMVQSNWTEPDKMGIPNSVLTPVILWMAMGLAGLLWGPGPWWRRALLPLGTGLLLALGVRSARPLVFPLDDRADGFKFELVHNAVPIKSLEEDPAQIAQARLRMTTPVMLPWLSRRQVDAMETLLIHERALRGRLSTLLEDLTHPEFAYYHATIPAITRSLIGLDTKMHFPVTRMAEGGTRNWFPGAPDEREDAPLVEIELDLGRAPGSNPTILRPAEGPGPEPIPLVGRGVLRVANLPVDWSEHPVALYGISGAPNGPILSLLFGRFDDSAPSDLPVLAWRDGGEGAEDRVRLAVPAGSLVALVQNTSLHPSRRDFWLFTVEADGNITQTGPMAQ
jgi:hypothetical protein